MTRRASLSERSNPSSATRASASSHANPVSAIALKRSLAVGEDAAFLWLSRSAVARSSAVTFDVLARLDERVSRRLYKLSERPVLAEHFLQHDHATFKLGLAFVTAVVALRGGAPGVFDELLTRLESDTELLSPLVSALSWLDYAEVRAHIEGLFAGPSPTLIQLGLVAAAAHRIDPGVALDRALDAETPALRASALEAVGRLALWAHRPRLHAALGDQDAMCRFRAAWSAVRLGDRTGIPVLGRFAAECGAFARPACDIALRALDTDQAVRAHTRLLSITGNQRLGVLAAGIVGDPALASWLLDAMESASLARTAGAAFSLMTGRDLRRDDLDGERPRSAGRPEVVAAAASESDGERAQADADLGGESRDNEVEDDLAWPDAVRLRQWWDQNRHAFVPGVRYLAGVPIRPATLQNVLGTGNQQQRAAAALELALLHPDAPLLDVMAPAHRQIAASYQGS
jgi:uncharacterized protein (TIGR02270 family)